MGMVVMMCWPAVRKIPLRISMPVPSGWWICLPPALGLTGVPVLVLAQPFCITGTTGDAPGYSLAFQIDGDGSSEVLIGAPLANLGGGNSSGAVYLSEESSSSMELGTDMVSYMGESNNNDRAGWSVAGGGDVNDDGYEDILIGAYLEDEGASNGAAYLHFGLDQCVRDTVRSECSGCQNYRHLQFRRRRIFSGVWRYIE